MIENLYNFLRLSDNLICSGMPGADQIAEVAGAGFQVVINLALPTSEKALTNEAGLVASQGMKYIHIPVEWNRPTRENLEDFMDTMDDNRGNRIFVHCQANYRATGFIALYRVLRLGWQKEKAYEDLRRIWNPVEYPVWQKFLQDNGLS
jgi:protein tyrosine phosphatase (PTP) superfamily phosphohydrolase (DUF442 family)